jgi:hypothetical protein
LNDAVSRRRGSWPLAIALASVVFACAVALVPHYKLRQPDPYAYRASIAALLDGRVALDAAQYQQLSAELSKADDGWDSGIGIVQWTRTPAGDFVSEKNPGYPFLVAPFGALGLTRLAPILFFLIGCAGLWMAGRRWLGAWGGVFAVALFCSSGTLVTMLHEAYMPTATEASLVAAGAGLVLWALLDERGGRRAVLAGTVGFLLAGVAVTVRYTAVVVLGVLVVAAVLWVARRASPVRARWLALWGGVGALGPALALVYDWLVFGSPLRTGYTRGVSFSAGAMLRNLRTVPVPLLIGMPVAVLAAAGVAWALVAARRPGSPARRRDLPVVGFLGAWWLAVWLTYLAYDWTTVVRLSVSFPLTSRFYLPALGALALLGALAVARAPRRVGVPLVAALLFVGAAASIYSVTGDWLYCHGTSPVRPLPGMPLPGAPGGFPGGAPPPGGMPSGAPSGGP